MAAAGTRVTWEVPKDFPDPEVRVILSVRDAKGQETFQSFTLAVRDPGPGGGDAPRPQPAPVPAPPGDLALRPAPLVKAEQTVNLPSTAGLIVPAAGGRLLIIHLPRDRKLAVFDTAAARVVKYLPAADDVKFAAGREELFVLLAGSNVLQRWDLKTLKRCRPSPARSRGR